MTSQEVDCGHMRRAIDLASRGQGLVEPNPMVGCVIAAANRVLGEGFHGRFGGEHAEVAAIRSIPDADRHLLATATLYVTLEPCCHHGKTPPCTDAILAADIERVVVAHRDPFPAVDGGGIRRLQEAGVVVEQGILEAESRQLLLPYLMRLEHGRPWVIAKWAMTLDGKLATTGGDSQWISSEASRKLVHQLRGRVDGILVGGGTLLADDPRLTARPPGPRVASRIVWVRSQAPPGQSQLFRTVEAAPIMIAGPADSLARMDLPEHVEAIACQGDSFPEQIRHLLLQLGERKMTNLLVEGGGVLLGALRDADLIDEVHVFLAPRIIGGEDATNPMAGDGVSLMSEAIRLVDPQIEIIEQDVHVHGRIERPETPCQNR